MNGPFFLRGKKQPEINEQRINKKENKKRAYIFIYSVGYLREYKPSDTAAENNDPQKDEGNISDLDARLDFDPF
jgi:hypothetical protein